MTDQSLGKAYKLCSKKAIENLFEHKKTIKNYPFILNYAFMDLPTETSFQVVISAPKRIFRKAHERNRIKRLMKEVLRKRKQVLDDLFLENKKQLALFLIYSVKEEMVYTVLESKMDNLLKKLANQIKNTSNEILN